MYKKAILYLSEDGNNIELKISDDHHTIRPVSYETDNIHPLLKRAQHANSYQKVLDLLWDIQDNPDHHKFVKLRHLHNLEYSDHRPSFFALSAGVAHRDSIDQLINFVEQRLGEEKIIKNLLNKSDSELSEIATNMPSKELGQLLSHMDFFENVEVAHLASSLQYQSYRAEKKLRDVFDNKLMDRLRAIDKKYEKILEMPGKFKNIHRIMRPILEEKLAEEKQHRCCMTM